MKRLIKLILFILVISLPIKINAYCTTEEKLRYSNLASNIETSYDYVEYEDRVSFSITIHNVHSDLIVLDKQSGRRYNSHINKLNNFTISNLKDGQSYVFEVYANNSDCTYRVYNTLYVTIPKFNKYYKDPVCVDASDYLYCQKWVEVGNISYDEFVKLVNDYKHQNIEEEIKEEKEENNWIYILGDFWAKYYLYISLGTILVCVSIIIIKNKQDKFEF